LVMLSLSILAGYGANYIFYIINNRSAVASGKESVAFILISCLVLFEFLSVPFWMASAEVPVFYKQLAGETDDYAILEVPGLATSDYMYFQTIHGKKLVNGYVSRTPDYALTFMSIPFISDLISSSNTPMMDDIMKQNQTELLSMLSYYKIKYIIIHKGYLSNNEFSFVLNLVHDVLGIEPVTYDSDGLWVYHIPTSQNSSQFISLGSGFHDLQNWSGTPTRWIQADAALQVFSPENRTANLRLQALSFYRDRTLEVSSGDALIAQVNVPTSFVNVSVPVRLAKGANTVRFHVPEGCERPYDKPELNSPDPRCLSVAVQNLTVA
jgi:hypothetical protein